MAFNEKHVAGSIKLSDDRTIKVRVVEVTGGRNEYTALDIRQFGDGDYTGPTKKGVMVDVAHLDELISALQDAKDHLVQAAVPAVPAVRRRAAKKVA